MNLAAGNRHDIWRFRLDIPMGVGHINIYLLRCLDSGKTLLIDTGPRDKMVQEGICSALEHAGHPIESLDGLLLTHEHLDHWGGTRALQERNPSMELIAHPEAYQAMQHSRERSSFVDFLNAFGGAGQPFWFGPLVRTFYEKWAVPRFSEPPLERNLRLVSQGSLKDYGVNIVPLPGHSAYHIGVEAAPFLLAGDTLWEGKTPNPFFSDGEPRRGIKAYLDTLDWIAGQDYGWALPAHGNTLHDLEGYARFIHEHHERRWQKMADVLDRPKSVYDILIDSRIVYGKRRFHPAHLFLAMCETLGHLEWAEGNGWVRSAVNPYGTRLYTL